MVTQQRGRGDVVHGDPGAGISGDVVRDQYQHDQRQPGHGRVMQQRRADPDHHADP